MSKTESERLEEVPVSSGWWGTIKSVVTQGVTHGIMIGVSDVVFNTATIVGAGITIAAATGLAPVALATLSVVGVAVGVAVDTA